MYMCRDRARKDWIASRLAASGVHINAPGPDLIDRWLVNPRSAHGMRDVLEFFKLLHCSFASYEKSTIVLRSDPGTTRKQHWYRAPCQIHATLSGSEILGVALTLCDVRLAAR